MRKLISAFSAGFRPREDKDACPNPSLGGSGGLQSGRKKMDAAPPEGLVPAPLRKFLPGSVRTVVSTPTGDLHHDVYPAVGGSNLASTFERRRMAAELQTQNAPTYASMSVADIVDLLSEPGKELHALSTAGNQWPEMRRSQVALSRKEYPAEGEKFPAGAYLFVSQLISNGDAGGLRGGGSKLVNFAKAEALKSGALGLKLYTDTEHGAAFYLKNGFDVIRTEDVGANTRRHMGWRASAGEPSST